MDQKDQQIRNLIEYVEAIKKEFAQYRQSFSHRLSMRISNDDSMGSASKLGESTFRGEQDAHEKIVELHN